VAARRVAIVGSGSIGVAWAIVFARAGCEVLVHDPDPVRLGLVPAEVDQRLQLLSQADLLREPVAAISARIHCLADLQAAVANAQFVHECGPEQLEIKRAIFADLDRWAPADAVLASSSSAITISQIADGLPGRHRALIAHPGNPPYLIPIVEIVPGPFTDERHVQAVMSFMDEVGMSPVHVRTEIEGFIFNRLQGAILREAYDLVRDGVATAADIDRVMHEGLGRRWALVGPFTTAHLNVRGGITAHAARMGSAYARMNRGPAQEWDEELVAAVAADLQQRIPAQEWDAAVLRRDEALMALTRAINAIAPVARGSHSFENDGDSLPDADA
jgi:L-gulonate 3-dehydrogenase